MTQQLIQKASAWQDRWSTPSLEQLIEGLSEQDRPAFCSLLEQLEGLTDVRRELNWYDVSWKWALQYEFTQKEGKQSIILCYLVPRGQMPLLCVPLDRGTIDKLPLRRLPRVIREGIRSSKCALQTHWATWNVVNMSDVPNFMDLLKRKYKILKGL